MAKRARRSTGTGLIGALNRLEAITQFLRFVPARTPLIPRQMGGVNPVEGAAAQCRARAVGSILEELGAIEHDLRKSIGK
jgi:hypothetical protein